jgi:dCTP diphosphatase
MEKDSKTTIQELKDKLRKFRDVRDWKQFHDPKNLAEAISVECGELQELFLWKNKEQISQELLTSKEYRQEVEEELADVVIFCLNFANAIDIDLSSVVEDKINKGNKKYPVEKAKGVATKYTKL